MNLAEYVKCLKKFALNKKTSDEEFLNAVLKPYIDAGEVDNKNNEEIFFDKSRTSLILNRHDDVPKALRLALKEDNIYSWTEENFSEFMDRYINPSKIHELLTDISEMIESEKQIICKEELLCKKDSPHIFLADVLIECIKLKNNGCSCDGEIVRNGSFYVKAIYDDIFKFGFRRRCKEKDIVVIPVDTNFHTHVTRNYERSSITEVSAKSLHGQFLIRWEQSGEDISLLRNRIENSLDSIMSKDDADKAYPIGTIATIENNSTIFYLLAISEFDDNNNAHSSKEEIIFAMNALSIFYDKYGDGLDLYIPLLGTGKSRAAVSLQESYDIIVDCYKKNRNRIQGNIHIVIYKDFENLINTEKEESQNVL